MPSMIANGINQKQVINPMKKYKCEVCGYIYDESKGDPDGDIPAGTKWEDLPEDWECPECGASRDEFELVE